MDGFRTGTHTKRNSFEIAAVQHVSATDGSLGRAESAGNTLVEDETSPRCPSQVFRAE
jgi:hypothetical protein